MGNPGDKIRFFKTADNQWQTADHRGYTAQIDYVAGPNPYTITINPGAVTSSWSTLENAKNEFRHFLLDKPVQ